MSNVVEFLEEMGRDAHLRYARGPEIEAALIQAGIEPAVRAAILADDPRLLESLLGASPNICCMVNVPEEEEESEEEDEEEDGEDEEAEDDKEKE
jgi:hypothetical protein